MKTSLNIDNDSIKALLSGAVFAGSWSVFKIFPNYKTVSYAIIFPLTGIFTSYYLLKKAYGQGWPDKYLEEVNDEGLILKIYTFWAFIPAKYQNWQKQR